MKKLLITIIALNFIILTGCNNNNKTTVKDISSITPKYEFTEEKISWNGRNIKRIRALKNFGNVKKYDVGGWIESEKNLSQHGNCWVFDDAFVVDNALVKDNAQVLNQVTLTDNSQLYDNAIARGKVILINDYKIGGNTIIKGTKVYGLKKTDNENIHENIFSPFPSALPELLDMSIF